MEAFAEFERALIKERQKEGIAIAKQKGKYKGRKRILTDIKIQQIKEKLDLGISKTRIAEDLSITRATLYNYLNLDRGGEAKLKNHTKQVA
jgi:DNA invertase Pin-like site-specific DNA recombinase